MPADALHPVVQKMIDAGESEENIATVIQHYKTAAAPASAMTARQSGFGASDRTDDAASWPARGGPSPTAIGQWFQEKLRPMLEQVAHPKTISDIAALLVPDAGVTATMRAGATASSSAGRSAAAVATSPGARTAAAEIVKHGATGAGAYVGGAPGAIAGSTIGESLAARIRPGPAVKAGEGAVSLPGYPRFSEAPAVVGPVATNAPAARAAVVDEFTAARTAKATTLPDQKALNETALAARRLAYQASQDAAPAAIVKASGKMHFTGAEMKEFARLRSRGLSLADAQTAVQTAKGLAAKLGGATDAEVKAAVAHREATGAW